MNSSDETLVIQIQRNGCADSMDELIARYAEYFPPLLRQLGVAPAELNDLTQDVMLRVCRGLAQFDHRAKFKTWATRIAINCVRDAQRQLQRIPPTVSAQALEEVIANPVDDLVGTELTMRAIDEAIKKLSEPLRLALVLTAIQGMTTDEAADVCGCSRNALYFRLHKARKLLTRELGEYLA